MKIVMQMVVEVDRDPTPDEMACIHLATFGGIRRMMEEGAMTPAGSELEITSMVVSRTDIAKWQTPLYRLTCGANSD